jgi:5'-3' exonuclease
MKRLIEQFEMEGKSVLLEYLLPSDHKHEVSTSHVITPGTEFMYKLSEAIRSYVISRINNDPGWRDIKVWSMFAFLLRINLLINRLTIRLPYNY